MLKQIKFRPCNADKEKVLSSIDLRRDPERTTFAEAYPVLNVSLSRIRQAAGSLSRSESA